MKDVIDSHDGANTGDSKGQVTNVDLTNNTNNGEPINHYNIDDATTDVVAHAILDLFNKLQDGKTVLTKDQIKDLFSHHEKK